MHMSIQMLRSFSGISTVERNLVATATNASFGQGWNQSIVQQLTIDGNFLTRFRKESPMGDMDMTICSWSRII